MSCCYKKEILVPPVETEVILECFLNVSLGCFLTILTSVGVKKGP